MSNDLMYEHDWYAPKASFVIIYKIIWLSRALM